MQTVPVLTAFPSAPTGYYTSYGYMGYVPTLNKYMEFSTYNEYLEYIS